MKEALYYKKLPDGKVQCLICPHLCFLSNRETGKCRSRLNHNGVMQVTNYGKTIALSIDPMEKKPLFHFYPGSSILSVGSNSCNFTCDFCQNYQTSQQGAVTREVSPETLLAICRKEDCDFVAFTYTEPFTWFEFVLDCSKYLQKNNIKTVLVTNGYINPEPLNELLPYIDAMNIDLKSIHGIFYRKFCGGTIKPVLDTIKNAAGKVHLEITNLLITNENDSEADVREIVDFVASVNPDIPLHFSRYYPCYKMKNPPTPIANLDAAKQIAQQKLNFVYMGNVITNKDTTCPNCHSTIIFRNYNIKCNISHDSCPFCGYKIYGKYR